MNTAPIVSKQRLQELMQHMHPQASASLLPKGYQNWSLAEILRWQSQNNPQP